MNATGIEYLNFTWSPLVGCSGLGCAVYNNCWAKYMKKRNLNGCPDCTAFKPHSHLERLNQPSKTNKPSLIGTCYSADFWDNGFKEQDRTQVLMTASIAHSIKGHWFINLTKQTQHIPRNYTFPKGWIQGASICTENDLYRVDDLLKSRAEKIALSIEPLYQRLESLELKDIDWIIIGGQTKPTKLPQKDWVDQIIGQADSYNIPVFIKNNLNPLGYNMHQFPMFLADLPLVTSCYETGDKKVANNSS